MKYHAGKVKQEVQIDSLMRMVAKAAPGDQELFFKRSLYVMRRERVRTIWCVGPVT